MTIIMEDVCIHNPESAQLPEELICYKSARKKMRIVIVYANSGISSQRYL